VSEVRGAVQGFGEYCPLGSNVAELRGGGESSPGCRPCRLSADSALTHHATLTPLMPPDLWPGPAHGIPLSAVGWTDSECRLLLGRRLAWPCEVSSYCPPGPPEGLETSPPERAPRAEIPGHGGKEDQRQAEAASGSARAARPEHRKGVSHFRPCGSPSCCAGVAGAVCQSVGCVCVCVSVRTAAMFNARAQRRPPRSDVPLSRSVFGVLLSCRTCSSTCHGGQWGGLSSLEGVGVGGPCGSARSLGLFVL
jgi:hypothetical protein